MFTRTENLLRVFERAEPFITKLHQMEEEDNYFYFRQLEEASSAHTQVFGKDYILLSSNNYLGLTTHPKVITAATEALSRYGFGSGSARPLSGTMKAHRELEEKLAWFKGKQDCLIYSTGYMANIGLITSLVGAGDTIILDRLSHASIIDGAKMSGAKTRFFKHNDYDDLQHKLASDLSSNKDHLCLVVVDSVYSMDGDVADLPRLAQLSRENRFLLLVDDAHGTGVLGATGRGAVEHFHLEEEIDLVMGTLSKSLGSMGAFVAGDRDLIYYLRHTSRPFIFNTSLPPIACAAASAAIDVLLDEPQLLDKLRANSDYLKSGLQHLGFDTLDSKLTPIIPVLIGSENKLHADYALP